MKYFRNAIAAFLTVPLISIGCSIAAGRHAVYAEISESITSSTPNINVYRYVNATPSLIYTGPATGYSNGLFESMDFSKTQRAVIFDWDSESYIYIERADSTISYLEEMTTIRPKGEKSSTLSDSGTITTNMGIVYNNKYYENVLMPNEQLNVPIRISNNSGNEKKYIPYIAMFDIEGNLIRMNAGNEITVPGNSMVSNTISQVLSGNTLATAKVFLWEKETQKPVHDAISLTVSPCDYYSDSFDTAEEIAFDKPVCGIINTETDTDIVKFSAAASGLYAMKLTSDDGVTAGLYNGTGELLKETTLTDEYIVYSLEKNKCYYLKFNGNANKSYSLTPASSAATETVVKNVGKNATLTEDNSCNVFSFTPTSDGRYIITAVGTENVKASLYNENFAFVASGNVSDEDTSFRISQTLQAGKTYYILVSPKSISANYTLYVEEPLAVVSVE